MKYLVILISSFLLFSCSKNPVSTNTKIEPRIKLSYTSQDSSEARDLALWASSQLVPSDSEVDEMLYNINLLRYTYKDSSILQNVIKQRFMLPWSPIRIAIKFDSVTAINVRNGTYSGWSALPSQAKYDSLKPPDELGWSIIRYSQHRNPWQLCKYYASLPGVIYCEPDGVIFADGSFPIYACIKNGQMNYIFVEKPLLASGTQYYFYYQDGQPNYAGIFYYNPDPKPIWWQDAKDTYEGFYFWGRNN
ncbi:MAG: hypothetical protein WCS69_10510 [Ignavibacteriaceae bacterium]